MCNARDLNVDLVDERRAGLAAPSAMSTSTKSQGVPPSAARRRVEARCGSIDCTQGKHGTLA
jgi:hypothetical protein